MSAHVVLSCEGHPSYGRCIATMQSLSQHTPTARADARAAGWVWRRGVGDLCPVCASRANEAAS